MNSFSDCAAFLILLGNIALCSVINHYVCMHFDAVIGSILFCGSNFNKAIHCDQSSAHLSAPKSIDERISKT